jgi:hypothetical protein
MIKSISLARASKSTDKSVLKGVTMATPVPRKIIFRFIQKIFVKVINPFKNREQNYTK